MDTKIENPANVATSNSVVDSLKNNSNNNYKLNLNVDRLSNDLRNSNTISLQHLTTDPASELSVDIVNKMINNFTNNNKFKDGETVENNNIVDGIGDFNAECNNNNGKDVNNDPVNQDESQVSNIADDKSSQSPQHKRKRQTSSAVTTSDDVFFRCIHCEATFSDVGDYRLHLAKHKGSSPAKQPPKNNNQNKRKNKKEYGNSIEMNSGTPAIIASSLSQSPHVGSQSPQVGLSQSPLMSLSQSPLFAQQSEPLYQNESQTKAGNPPFKCRVCQKTFSFPCNLKQHCKLHGIHDPFSCDCGIFFISASQFTKHYKQCQVVASNNINTPTTTQTPNISPIVIKPKGSIKKTGLKFCIVCGHFCSSQTDLDIHMKTHSNENLLNCEKCGKHFINPDDLFQHSSTHLKNSDVTGDKGVQLEQSQSCEVAPYTEIAPVHCCDICKINFKNPDELTNHLTAFHLNRPIKLEKEDFDSNGLANSLVDNHLTPNTKTCHICHKSVNESEMELHLSNSCPNKELHIKTVNGLLNNNNQIGLKIENCLFLCPHCPVSFETEHELLNHIHLDQCNDVPQQDNQKSKKKSKNKNEQFTSVNGSPKGKKRGSPKKSPCVIRPKKDSVKTADSPDPDDITILSESRRYKCDLCEESFMHCQELKVHKQEHEGKKCYTCKVCGKRFVKSSAMFYHSKIHTGEEPYKCQFCGKTFRSTSNLKAHENLHTGLKMFKCDICCKEFRSNSNLRTHMKFHSDDKPFKCVFCDKEFAVRYNLKVHLRTHSGDKHYKCQCGKSYSSNEGLKRHAPKCTA